MRACFNLWKAITSNVSDLTLNKSLCRQFKSRGEIKEMKVSLKQTAWLCTRRCTQWETGASINKMEESTCSGLSASTLPLSSREPGKQHCSVHPCVYLEDGILRVLSPKAQLRLHKSRCMKPWCPCLDINTSVCPSCHGSKYVEDSLIHHNRRAHHLRCLRQD